MPPSVRTRALALLLLCGCTEPLIDQQRGELARAMKRWSDAGPAGYAFTFQVLCFCGPSVTTPVRITVRHDSVLSVVDAATSAPADTTYLARYLTVPRIFASLRATLDQDPATFSASYDAALGYPISVQADPIRNAVDDEFGLELSDFQVVP